MYLIHSRCTVSKRDHFLLPLLLMFCTCMCYMRKKLINNCVYANQFKGAATWMINYIA